MTKFSYFLGSEQWQPEDLIKHAVIAKDAGFDMLTISEHFHPWVDDYSASNFTWSTLGALANTIPQLDLGTGVTTPLWRIHPGVIAQAAATIDRLTPKTFHLGVGTGENINEGPLGYNFPNYEERKDRLISSAQARPSDAQASGVHGDGIGRHRQRRVETHRGHHRL